MKAVRSLDHLLAKHLGWPLAFVPLLRLGLKCTGWWALYQKLKPGLHGGGNWEGWFSHFSVKVEGLEVLPVDVGYSIVANHPLGFLDGWALGVALKDRRERVVFFAHPILSEFPGLKSHAIPMKPGSDPATKEVRASIRKAAEHISRGGILIRFETQKSVTAAPRTDRVLHARITPIWAEGQGSRKMGTWWTRLWMPKRLVHLDALKVQFASDYQV